MRRFASLIVALSVLLVSCVCSSRALGQDAGADERGYDMRGVVTNPDGAAVRNAQVSVIGVEAVTTTNDSGQFLIDRLPRGTRVVEVRAIGFAPQLIPIAIGPKMGFVFVRMERITMLDSVRIVAVSGSEFVRRRDVIAERELNAPDIIGGSALQAVQLLRPQLLNARAPTSFYGESESARRGQLYVRSTDSSGAPVKGMGLPAELASLTTTAGSMSVSVNEGPPGSPDVLAVIPVRRIKEIRLLRPLEASARFGPSASSGPVLVIYTK